MPPVRLRGRRFLRVTGEKNGYRLAFGRRYDGSAGVRNGRMAFGLRDDAGVGWKAVEGVSVAGLGKGQAGRGGRTAAVFARVGFSALLCGANRAR